MRIGLLKKRLTLQQQSMAQDGSAIWTDVAQLWGEIIPTADAANLPKNNRTTHVIRLRYDPNENLGTGMRLVDGNRAFQIHGILHVDEGHRWTDVHTEENVTLE